MRTPIPATSCHPKTKINVARLNVSRYLFDVSIEELQMQLRDLPLDERRQLTAFLLSLRHKELSGYREELAAKIDDKDAANWVSFEEFDKRISA
jgi:hypothetical protein